MKIISKALFFVISFLLFSSPIFLSRQENNYTIVIHGGAGYISPEISTEIKEAYRISLTSALTIGKKILENGGRSLDAVDLVIRYFENDSLFNAGKGAVFTSEGTHELDASIMNGVDLSTGAVTGVPAAVGYHGGLSPRTDPQIRDPLPLPGNAGRNQQ